VRGQAQNQEIQNNSKNHDLALLEAEMRRVRREVLQLEEEVWIRKTQLKHLEDKKRTLLHELRGD